MRTRTVLPALCALALLGGVAAANPLGDEVRLLDTESSKSLYAGDVAYNPKTDRFLVAYADSALSAPAEVHLRQVSGVTGQPVGSPLQVSSVVDDFGGDWVGLAGNLENFEWLVTWTSADNGREAFGQLVSASGAEIGSDFRISHAGTDNDFRNSNYPSAVYNPDKDEYLVVFVQETAGGDNEIVAQRLTKAGAEVVPEYRITTTGAADNDNFQAFVPRVAYNTVRDEYLVTYYRNHALDSNDGLNLEIHYQRLDVNGAEIGTDDARLTTTGADNDDRQSADAHVVYNPVADDYLVTWESDAAPLADDKQEVFGRRLSSDGVPQGAGPVQLTTTPDPYDVIDADLALATKDAASEYLVLAETTQFGTNTSVYGQRLSATAAPVGARFAVARPISTSLDSWIPAAAGRTDALDWLAAYSSNCRPNRRHQIFVRRIHSGAAAGPGTCPPPPPGTQDPPPSGGGGDPAPQPPATTPPVLTPPAPAVVPPRPPAVAPSLSAASVMTLPSTRKCLSRRSFKITLKQPRGGKLASAVVAINGRTKTTVRGAKLRAPVNLTGLPAGTFTVKVTVKTADGRTATDTRRYKTCAKKRKARKKR